MLLYIWFLFRVIKLWHGEPADVSRKNHLKWRYIDIYFDFVNLFQVAFEAILVYTCKNILKKEAKSAIASNLFDNDDLAVFVFELQKYDLLD